MKKVLDEYLSDDEDVYSTEDGIPSQDKNQLGGKILAVWERYKPLLDHDYSRSGYMLSVDAKTYAHARLSVFYIYDNYHVIFLKCIILKIIYLCLICMQDHHTSEYHMEMV